MKAIVYIFFFFLLTSCSSIYFYDIQSFGGKEIKTIPAEFSGDWLMDNNDTVTTVARISKNHISSLYWHKLWKEEITVKIKDKNVRCFKKDDFFILNRKVGNAWDVTIIKKINSIDYHVWLISFYQEAKLLRQFPELQLISWSDFDDNTYSNNFIVEEETTFQSAKFNGIMTAKNLNALTIKIKPIIAKKSSKAVFFTPDSEIWYENTILP